MAGPTSVGKTTLAERLAMHEGTILQIRDALALRLGVAKTRANLQRLGAELEAETQGAWLAEEVTKIGESESLLVVDSVRTLEQVRHVRVRFPLVTLVLLNASPEALARRFSRRADIEFEEGASLSDVVQNELEAAVCSLADEAEVELDTTTLEPKQVEETVLESLRRLPTL